MQLQLTGMGREVDFETGKEKGTLTFNKGLVRIQIDDDELKKIIDIYKMNPVTVNTDKPKEDFYVESGTILDEDIEQYTDVYAQNEIEEPEVFNEDIEEF